MAKKYTRKSSINKIDQIVNRLYKFGILHSIVTHTAILLFLALLFPSRLPDKKPITINLSFVSTNEMVEPIDEKFIDIAEVDLDKSASSIEKDDNKIFVEEEYADSIDIPIPEFGDTQPNRIEEIPIFDITQQIPQTAHSKKEEKPGNTKQVLLTKKGTSPPVATPQGNDNYLGEVDKRLKEYGAKTGDVQISLSWDTVDDLDLHVVVQPIGSHINFMNPMGVCGGILDIDMNAHPGLLTNRPIENVFWARGGAPPAEYFVGVHFYMNWSRALRTKAMVVVKVNGEKKTFPVVVRFGGPVEPVTSFRFQR